MSKENVKTLSIEITKETWKKLKIISIQREITLVELSREILEKSVSKKNVEEMI